MPTPLSLAIGSTTSLPGAVDANLEQISAFARRAAADGARLLLTPELSACGYGGYPETLATAEVAGDGPIYKALAAVAQETGVIVTAGFVEQAGELRHLAHYVVFPGGSYLVQRKYHVTPAEAPLTGYPRSEPGGLPEIQTFEVDGVRCAILICADSGMADRDAVLEKLGVRLLLLPTGAGGKREDRVTTAELRTPEGRATYQRVLETVFFPRNAIAECISYRRALAAVNLCGYDERCHYHVGHGMIITPLGEVPAFFHGLPNLDRQRPQYAQAEIDFDEHI